MSGPELVGIISGTITIIDATIKVCRAASDSLGLPATFREIHSRLPLVQDTLQATLANLDASDPDTLSTAPLSTLRSCQEKTERLAQLVDMAVAQKSDSRAKRCLKAVNAVVLKGQKAEGLMQGILADLSILSANNIAKAPTVEQLSDMLGSRSAKGAGYNEKHTFFENTGSGTVIVCSGKGDQMLNVGSGPQITGSFQGPFYF